jgi:hypothetical protein
MTAVRNLLWSSCALAMLTSLPAVAGAQEQRMIEDLRGTWKFQIGDDQRWADPSFNDEKWDNIFAPSPWENEGYPGYDGYAWYRKRFVAQEDWQGKGPQPAYGDNRRRGRGVCQRAFHRLRRAISPALHQ